jgi:hypothetical protein
VEIGSPYRIQIVFQCFRGAALFLQTGKPLIAGHVQSIDLNSGLGVSPRFQTNVVQRLHLPPCEPPPSVIPHLPLPTGDLNVDRSFELGQKSSTPRSRATSRLMLSVKRTLSVSGRQGGVLQTTRYEFIISKTLVVADNHLRQTPGLLSTQEESTARHLVHQFRDPDPAASRPTVEQIAMGLHLSRTPHLRPLSSSPYAFPQR